LRYIDRRNGMAALVRGKFAPGRKHESVNAISRARDPRDGQCDDCADGPAAAKLAVVLPVRLTLVVGERFHRAAAELLEAADCARDLAADPWDFAIRREDLRSHGLTDNDLRRLVVSDYLLHQLETTTSRSKRRVFRQAAEAVLVEGSSFILTAAGEAFLADDQVSSRTAAGATSPCPESQLIPNWDQSERRLTLGNLIVKEYLRSARNQEAILEEFQRQCWAPVIDDPLPPDGEMDPPTRLHDTINSMNRGQTLLRFFIRRLGMAAGWRPATRS